MITLTKKLTIVMAYQNINTQFLSYALFYIKILDYYKRFVTGINSEKVEQIILVSWKNRYAAVLIVSLATRSSIFIYFVIKSKKKYTKNDVFGI